MPLVLQIVVRGLSVAEAPITAFLNAAHLYNNQANQLVGIQLRLEPTTSRLVLGIVTTGPAGLGIDKLTYKRIDHGIILTCAGNVFPSFNPFEC